MHQRKRREGKDEGRESKERLPVEHDHATIPFLHFPPYHQDLGHAHVHGVFFKLFFKPPLAMWDSAPSAYHLTVVLWYSFAFILRVHRGQNLATSLLRSPTRPWGSSGAWNGQNPTQFQVLSSNWPLALSSEYFIVAMGVFCQQIKSNTLAFLYVFSRTDAENRQHVS